MKLSELKVSTQFTLWQGHGIVYRVLKQGKKVEVVCVDYPQVEMDDMPQDWIVYPVPVNETHDKRFFMDDHDEAMKAFLFSVIGIALVICAVLVGLGWWLL